MDVEIPQPSENLINLPRDAFWVLQVSDTHLYAQAEKTLAGVNTLRAMQQTLDMALRTLPRKPDILIATGDLVHDASAAGYDTLAQSLLDLGIPSHCLPGNHDDNQLMLAGLRANGMPTDRCLDIPHWRILLLDSTVPGKEGGHLQAHELSWIKQQIQATDKHLLLCLHHQPMRVGSRWIDSMMLDNGHELATIIEAHPQVKGIVWGHVHQAFEHVQNGVHWLSSPATCIQFTPQADDFSLDSMAPGCRILALGDKGEIHTRVLRLDTLPTQTQLDVEGY